MSDLIVHCELNDRSQVFLAVIGELDASTAPQLHAAVDASPVPVDVLDCRFVSFVSAAGLTALLEIRKSHPSGIVASAVLDRILDICELRGCFDVITPSEPPLLDHAAFGVALLDAELRFLYVNPVMARLNGLPPHLHIGRRPNEIFDLTDDPITPRLAMVVQSGVRQSLLVSGSIPATDDGLWSCRCMPAYVGDGIEPSVIVTVEALTEPTGPEPSARIGFTRRLANR